MLCSPLSFAKISIEIKATEVASIFEILDNTSLWWDGFCDTEYREYWEKEFKISSTENKLFEEYKHIREKYYFDPDQKEKDPSINRNGLFGTIGSLKADEYAQAFYAAQSLEDAYLNLKKILTRTELKFIIKFYQYFQSKYQVLVNGIKKKYADSILTTSKTLQKKETLEYLQNLAKFYGVKKDLVFRVIFTWWPPINSTRANPVGRFLILKNNPEKHMGGDYSDIAIHELTHVISKLQTLSKKQELTSLFLKVCQFDFSRIKRFEVLEEPLAVIFGQIYFTEIFKPKKFKLESNWYNNKRINKLAKLYYKYTKEHFDAGNVLDDKLIKNLAIICAKNI